MVLGPEVVLLGRRGVKAWGQLCGSGCVVWTYIQDSGPGTE